MTITNAKSLRVRLDSLDRSCIYIVTKNCICSYILKPEGFESLPQHYGEIGNNMFDDETYKGMRGPR